MPLSRRHKYMQAAYKATIKFDNVAKEVFSRHGRRWKPRTMKVNQNYYDLYIKPFFGDMLISGINKADVSRWFGEMAAIPGSDQSSLARSVCYPRLYGAMKGRLTLATASGYINANPLNGFLAMMNISVLI